MVAPVVVEERSVKKAMLVGGVLILFYLLLRA
jgi:hypothetical protein